MAHALLPDPAALTLDGIDFHEGFIAFRVHPIAETAPCPKCARRAHRVHSRYRRTLLDLPWQANPVRVLLSVRKLFCDYPDCQQQIFTEPTPKVAPRYRRKTARLEDALQELTYLVGGEAAARIAQTFGMLVSPDSLLDSLKKAADQPAQTPRVLGVDDFAFRKGHRYGTILIDQERRCPVDLLPDRDASTLEAWLKAHPGVQIVTRDRAEAYRSGITKGAPQALQVADRWHLLKNLGEAIEKLLARCHRHLHEALQDSRDASADAAPSRTQAPPPEKGACPHRRQRRQERFEQVHALWKAGNSIGDIQRQTGRSPKTIRSWLMAAELPPRRSRPERPGKITAFEEYLRRRFGEGCRNAALLFAEIQAMGYCGGYTSVKDLLSQMRSRPSCRSAPRARLESPRRLAWVLTNRDDAKVSDVDRALLDRVCESCPEIRTASDLGGAFCGLVRERRCDELSDWLDQARRCGVREMSAFASGLSGDLPAVEAALSVSWSNGPVEGQVNRLKFVKRQGYGRAGFDLLRRRVLPLAA